LGVIVVEATVGFVDVPVVNVLKSWIKQGPKLKSAYNTNRSQRHTNCHILKRIIIPNIDENVHNIVI
jgi:hypothetical protein